MARALLLRSAAACRFQSASTRSLLVSRVRHRRAPADALDCEAANTPGLRHLAFAVDDIDAVVASLRARSAELVGEVERYKDSYRLCYVRGPEGIIVELVEQLG
jgi:catechol 2,3-dioxygenase-like lactoylglutathione lyase family enzyme